MPFSIGPHRRFSVQGSVTDNSGTFPNLPLGYLFGFWSIITQLVLSSAPVYAEWVAVEKPYLSPGLRTLYVDPTSIRRQGNLVTLWQLIDFTWMQGNAGMDPLGFGPHRFLSTTTQKQFDCREKRVRSLAFTEFSRHMGTGIPSNGYVDPDNWMPVEPDSINEALWEVGCAKE
jgi:hypothetical protein